MNFTVLLATFAIILPAELPDKSMVASFVMGAKYKPLPVFAGVAAAFAVQVGIAVVIGGLLGLLPHQLLELIVGALFALGAVLIIREHGGEAETDTATRQLGQKVTPWRVSAMAFGVIFTAEFGDLTQIAIANLAAKFHDPWSVTVGGVLALWTAGAIGTWGGRSLARFIPLRVFIWVTATILALLSVFSFVAAF